MAERIWETSKLCFCEHVMSEVGLEVEVLYPIDFLPDPPRVRSHRCSHGMECNRSSKASCIWAGTNPDYDPFRQ
jgi:hypothetical protein